MAIILSKQERAVMQSVYDLTKDKQSVLIGAEDIMNQVKLVGRFYWKRPASEDAPELSEAQVAEAEEVVPPESLEEAESAATEEKISRRFWRRHSKDKKADEETEECVPKFQPKVYVDEPPVYKGLRVYEKPVHYDELAHVLEILFLEEYIDATPAVDEGETKYIIKLLNRGKRWERDERDRKRNVGIRLLTIVATPILSFVLGLLLKYV